MKLKKCTNKFFCFITIIFSILLIISFISFVFLRLNFPLKYQAQVKTYSKTYNVEEPLIYAIIKTESGFDKGAVSKKGAQGLMQIMPSTAEFIARRLKIEGFDMFCPEQNVMFGTYYFSYLLNKFGDETTALSAYNAGEGNVKEWLKNKEYSFDGKTLRKIPFKETREYVKKVQTAKKIYSIMYY